MVGKYIKGNMLGRGAFAEVFQFTDKNSGKVYAGKKINMHKGP